MSTRGLFLTVAGAGCLIAASVVGFRAMQIPPAEALVTSTTVEVIPTVPESRPNPPTAGGPAPAVAPVAAPPSRTTSAAPPPRRPGNSGASRSRPAAAPTKQPETVTTPVPPPVAAPPVDAPVTSANATGTPPPAQATEIATPAVPAFDEITIEDASVIGIELDSAVTSETAKVEDKISGRVSRDVTVGGKTAIPAGTRIEGHVTAVEPGGKFKGRARLGIRFTTIVLSDRTRVSMQTDPIFREGDAPGAEATAKVGAGSVVGAIIGGVVGGRRSAAIGAAAGAAGGTAVVMAGGRNHAVLAAGSPLTLRLTAPVTVLIERRDPR